MLERCRIGCFGKWIWVIKERKMRCCERESMVGKLYRSSAAYSSNFFFIFLYRSIDRPIDLSAFICLSAVLYVCLSGGIETIFTFLFYLSLISEYTYCSFCLIAFFLFLYVSFTNCCLVGCHG